MNTLNTPKPDQVPAVPRIVIERSHSSQTDAGLALLNHLANASEACSFDALYAVFCQAKGGAQALHATTHNLQNILCHMVERGQLTVSGAKGKRLWRFGDMNKLPSKPKAQAVLKATLRVKAGLSAHTVAAPYVGLPAPPPQYDLQRAPVYVPPPSPMPRAGSLDFQRVASHGYGC